MRSRTDPPRGRGPRRGSKRYERAGIVTCAVRGTRIPVATIAGLLAEKVTVQDVLQHYPQLTAQDVQACRAPTAGRDQL